MAGNAENPKIGLSNVVVAPLIEDDGINPPSYGAVIPLRGAVQASVNPNSSVETDYADNGAFFVTNNRGNTEMTLELTNADPNTLALMLGQERVNGITVEKPLDQSKYFALGFQVGLAVQTMKATKSLRTSGMLKVSLPFQKAVAQPKAKALTFSTLRLPLSSLLLSTKRMATAV